MRLCAINRPVSQDRALQYDRLGQLAVTAGEIAEGHAAFDKAHKMAQRACGAEAPFTKKLEGFRPMNQAEIVAHFQ